MFFFFESFQCRLHNVFHLAHISRSMREKISSFIFGSQLCVMLFGHQRCSNSANQAAPPEGKIWTETRSSCACTHRHMHVQPSLCQHFNFSTGGNKIYIQSHHELFTAQCTFCSTYKCGSAAVLQTSCKWDTKTYTHIPPNCMWWPFLLYSLFCGWQWWWSNQKA